MKHANRIKQSGLPGQKNHLAQLDTRFKLAAQAPRPAWLMQLKHF